METSRDTQRSSEEEDNLVKSTARNKVSEDKGFAVPLEGDGSPHQPSYKESLCGKAGNRQM